MRQLSVLHVMNSFASGSIASIVLWLIEHLSGSDIRWHVGATREGDMEAAFMSLGCEVTNLTRDAGKSPRESLRNYVVEHGINVVHTHTPRTIVDVSLALRGVPTVKHVATKHLLNAPADRRWGLAYTALDRLTLYLADVVVPVSSTMRERIISQPFVDPSKVVLIRNAIPIERFYRPQERAAHRRELALPANATVLGYAGRIDKVKRIDLLLNAFRNVLVQHPQCRLVIAGEGSLTPEMHTLADALGISHAVRWPGFHRNMPGLLAAIDIYVQVSDNEGLSLSILEAMAAGKAVVATDVGGANEVIEDGETGVLIPAGSTSEIVTALLTLLNDPDARARIALAGKAYAQSEFDLGKMVSRYGALYARVVDAHSEQM